MVISYEEFVEKLEHKIKFDQRFYNELLITILQNPDRYTGVFRLSNTKSKLIQNVTQSREIKFGDFLEEVITVYIERLGYNNIPKRMIDEETDERYAPDQIFEKNGTIYLIEQKIRDDHDSTKKRGQLDNFLSKISLVKRKYPKSKVIASMWFIDDNFKKNRNYYIEMIDAIELQDTEVFLFYGRELFDVLFERPDAWDELINHLIKYKTSQDEKLLNIPDFDTSEEIYNSLKNLKRLSTMSNYEIREEGYKGTIRPLYSRIFSDDEKYKILREELFPTGYNLERIKEDSDK